MKALQIIASCLLVSMMSVGMAFHLPRGNYLSSCSRCSLNANHVLKCLCRDRSGYYRLSRIHSDQRCSYIENINGRFYYESAPGRKTLSKGL